jgi:hypothetical protein
MLHKLIGKGSAMKMFPQDALFIGGERSICFSGSRQVNMLKTSERTAMLHNACQNLSPSPLGTPNKLL